MMTMHTRADGKPFQRSEPTAEALALARQVAEVLGLPFDADAVAADSVALHERYFADLCQVLCRDPARFRLESGLFFATRVFAGLDRANTPTISVDLAFDYWLFALT